LKRASTTTKTEVAAMRAEPRTMGTADVYVSATLLRWCHLLE